MINALAFVEGETDYADFIDYVNTEITHYKQEVISGRSASGKEEEAEKKWFHRKAIQLSGSLFVFYQFSTP